MFHRSRKSTFLLTICIIYILDSILSGTLFGWQKTYAAPTHTDIISVFVDTDVAGSFDLEWFTNSYIGRNYDTAKVVVFQINPTGVGPAEMVKINQNLYLEGTKNGPSRLVGTILIGNIKLPMVNKQGFIFPTVYPLVDFDKPKYYYNPVSDYFEYQSEGNSQPEVWHSIINFGGDLTSYGAYIDKLKEYAKDPTKWVSKGMRYEDILHQKQTLITDNFPKYVNSYVFGEDMMYNRYTNLMVDTFNALHNSGVVDILGGYNSQSKINFDDEYYDDPAFQEVKSSYQKEVEKFWNVIKSLKKVIGGGSSTNKDVDPSPSSLGSLPNSKYINTLFLQKVVEGFIKDYLEMYGTSYFDTKEKRVSLGGRYINVSPIVATTGTSTVVNSGASNGFVDDHITLTTKRDEVSKQLMIDINTKLEGAVNDKIEQEGYAMNVLVPTRDNPEKKKVFEVYYFGLPAELITDAMDFSIYRGTFNNIRSLNKLTRFDFTSWMDYSKFQSVGATRGENAREVEAHRGYDFSLIENDQEEFEQASQKQPYKKIRKKDRKDINKMVSYYRAGYTLFNIDKNSDDLRLDQSRMDYTQLWNPFKDRTLGGGVFDIAGSRITTDDRVVGFTLGSDSEDGSDGEDDEGPTNQKSYSGYSDSYLGMDFFRSAIQVTKNNGNRLKFKNRLGKYKYRKTGKPRNKDRSTLVLRNLGETSKDDGLFLLPNDRSYNTDSDYITIQPKSDDHHNRYFKSVDTVYRHISPTLEELYGEYVTLQNVDTGAIFNCSEIEPDDVDLEETCTGFSFSFTDIHPGIVSAKLYAKKGVDYTINGSRIFFNNSAVWHEYGTEVNFDNAIGTIAGTTVSITKHEGIVEKTYKIPWRGEYPYDCELHNAEAEREPPQCKGLTFAINNRKMVPVGEQYFDLYESGTRIEFYSGASVSFQGKSIDLGGLVAIVDPDTKIATFTGRKLQVGGINEFTLERPIDSPRYLNFQGIGGDKVTWIYPNIWKVPVFKEVEGNKILMNQNEIKVSIRSYLRDIVKKYNIDLTQQYAKRFDYYNERLTSSAYPKSYWIDILAPYDWTLSPLVQSDNTGLFLRSYKFLPDDYLIDQLVTTWNKKEVSSDDMIDILAEQLYYQNTMRQELPLDTTKSILTEIGFYQSFADSNHKSHLMLNEYMTQQPTSYLENSNSLSLKFPYYQSGGYELGYINSDGSDYMQLESLPPLITLIQKQQAKSSDNGKKTKEQLSPARCDSKIPASYVVALSKRPAAVKCRREDVSHSPFELSIGFIGSANGVSFDSLGKTLESEIATPYRNQWSGYSQQWRTLVKDKDEGLSIDESKTLYKKLDNLTVSFDSQLPQIGSTVRLTISPKSDLGSYSIQLFTTGSNCLVGSQGSSLCQGNGASLSIKGKDSLLQSYTLDPSKPNGVGDMLTQIKVCAGSKCVYRSFVLTVQPGPIQTFKFVTPGLGSLLPIARGSVFPLIIVGYDAQGNQVGSTPHNFSLTSTNKGGLIYQNQLATQHELSSFMSAGVLYDSSSTQGDGDTLSIKPLTKLTNAQQELRLEVVDPEINLSLTTNSFTLPENNQQLELINGSKSTINLSLLPKLTLTINNGKPIYSLIDISLLGGKFIPGIKKSIPSPKQGVDPIDSFEPIDQLLFTGGVVEIYLYPTMKAGDDMIEVKLGSTVKSIPISVKPAKPYKTVLSFSKSTIDLLGSLQGTVAVTDIRGNIIYDTTKVLLGLFGNLTVDGVVGSGSTIDVVGEQSITIKPVYPGGQGYIFSTLPSLPFDKQIPDYQSILIQNRSRPVEKLSIAYLNLYGSNRSEQKDNQTNKLITSSLLTSQSKTLAITTQINDLSKIFKSVLMMRSDGSLMSLDGSNATGGSFPTTVLGGVSGYNTPYGRLPFGSNDINVLSDQRKKSIDSSKYQVVTKKIGQSSEDGIFLQEINQTLDSFDNQVPSIQNSNDPHYDIGFGDTFKPMTNFAQGQSVGQSSLPFASEYVINIGDPTYRQGETNRLVGNTTYDGGVGKSVYSDPGKIIDQVVDIDRDKGGNKDLLVVYTDGSLRLLIARGMYDYQPVGDLAYIYDGIKKVYVGDGDGDGYQDIFIETLSRQLRFYKNYDGERIDVDGYPICLDLTSKQSGSGDQATDFGSVYQWMLTDPNNDKVTDIVLLDHDNVVRLFLGGGGGGSILDLGGGGGNYISRDKLGCDPDRRKRQEGKSTVIKSFAPQINGQPIKDDSLVHRKGLLPVVDTAQPEDPLDQDDSDDAALNMDIPDTSEKPTPKEIKGVVKSVESQIKKQLDSKKLLNEYLVSLENTVILGGSYRPSYEGGTGDEILYKSLTSLLPADRVDTSKTFTDLNGGRLEDGDIVKITITIKNNGASKATYIEKLTGPWEVPLKEGKQTGFFSGTLGSDYQFILSPGPSYVFMVDNITLGSTTTFGYHVVYKSQQLVTIKHGEDFISKNGIGGSIGKIFDKAFAQNDENTPAWLEITPLDGCAKFKWKIIAENVGPILSNRFREIKIDIGKKIREFQDQTQKDADAGLGKTFDDLTSDKTAGVNESILDNIIKETWKQKGILEEDPALQMIEYAADMIETLGNANLGFNVNVGLFGGDIDALLESKISSLTRGLCNGFQFKLVKDGNKLKLTQGTNSCSGIPVLSNLPFNMAFLSPGDLQVMGCKILSDKGLPAFTFPGNRPTGIPPYLPLPGIFGLPQKGPGDGFYGISGGPYASMMRLYLSPTLTAKLGIGICFGTYGMPLPKPFRDVAGNCIVFAVDPGIGKCKPDPTTIDKPSSFPADIKQFDNTDVCNDDLTIARKGPLKMVETAINSTDNRLESVQGEYGLVIKLGGYANLTNYDSLSLSNFFSKVTLEGGNPLDLKVKGAMDRGLVSCLMNQFVDNQIRYLVNNLTTLNINIVLPDVKGLGQQVAGIGSVLIDPQKSDAYVDLSQDTAKTLATNKNLLSKQQLTKRLDTTIANPFDQLEVLFNQSELIHISSRDVLIELPMIYTEDITTAKGILLTRLERNRPIRKAWTDTYKDIVKQCDEKYSDQFDRDKCKQSANSMLQFNNQLGQFERSIRQNIETLDMYGQLPKQVYELLHGYDRYIYDIFNFAYGTIDTITAWLSKVARGIDAWIDFIISLSGILKSWQIMIDFSVNWKEKCSKCTVDNYSAYSCSFAPFCPKLPVFAIPPFKLPSITLDMSQIDFSTQIILPRLRFQPKSIGIIDNLLQFGLPDTPYPPSLGGIGQAQINISLPKVPVIPRPPDLSMISLPSFIPQIKFKGPTLPPAPRIPKIAPELGLAIEIADFLGRILCIVKGGIGLVGEKGLKSKIEQITQRTRQVEPFDSIKVLVPKAPLQTWNLFKSNQAQGGSFDLKLDSFVNVRMYFDNIYGVVDGIAQSINEGTRKVLRDSDQLPGVKEVFDRGAEGYNTVNERVEEYDTTNVVLPINPFGYQSEYRIINHKLSSDLAGFTIKDTQPNHTMRKRIAGEVQRSYTLPTSVQINTDGINQLKESVSQILDKELETNDQLKNRVQQDYDGWLKHIVSTQYVSDERVDISLKTSLIDINPDTLSYLQSTDLIAEYLDGQKTVVDGYTNALQRSDYATLGMNKSDYEQSRDYLSNLQQHIDTVYNNHLTTKSSGGEGALNGSLIAQAPPNPPKPPAPVVSSTTIDPAAHIAGYFVRGNDDNYYNVIANIPKGEELSKTLFEKDLNGDGSRELVSWDQHSLYIKYAAAKKRDEGTSRSADVSRITLDSSKDIEQIVDEYGYYDDLKLNSLYWMPKEWRVAGQAYQSMTYSVDSEFDTHPGLVGYIVRYSDSLNGAVAKDAKYQYLLLLDQSLQGTPIDTIDIDGERLDIDKVTIQYLPTDQKLLSAVLSNIPRRWYFSQVAKLQMSEYTNPLFKILTLFESKVNRTITKSSPWSLYETAGMQIIADNSAPYPDVALYREKKQTIAGQSDTIYGTIKTYYTLSGLWYDDSKVVKNWILDGNNKRLASQDNDRIFLQGIYSDKPVVYTYKLVGEDAAGNVTQKDIIINLQLPKLALDSVATDSFGQSKATTNLSVDVDTGALSYIRIRNGVESILQSLDTKKSLFDTTTNQYTVTGGSFGFKQDRGFYDAQGKYLNISITPQGQIINSNGSIKVLVDFVDNTPKISLQQGGSELYRIYLKAISFDKKSDITLLDGSYETVDLPNNAQQLGQFSNGVCVKLKEGVCEIMVSPQGFIFVAKPYHRLYTAEYGFADGKVVYTIKKGSTRVVSIKATVETIK